MDPNEGDLKYVSSSQDLQGEQLDSPYAGRASAIAVLSASYSSERAKTLNMVSTHSQFNKHTVIGQLFHSFSIGMVLIERWIFA